MDADSPERPKVEPMTSPQPGRVLLGGFGKHPAWNDFIKPHLGHETPLMARAKREFFFGTVRVLVDTKAWEGVPAEKSSTPAQWHWVWQERNEFLLGVMWPSQDGTRQGREFPMVLCAHVRDLDVRWSLEQLLPVLSRAAQRLRELKTPGEVSQCVIEAQEHCDQLAAGPAAETAPQYLALASGLREDISLRSPPEALSRTLHVLRTSLADLAIGGKEVARKIAQEFASLRLPCPAARSQELLAAWLALLRTQIDNQAPVLLVHPAGADWCDALVGGIVPGSEASERSTLRLRQNLTGTPLTTATPYTLDAEFLRQTQETLDSIPLAWGDPAKRSIFGSVPSRYRPYLPGEAAPRDTLQGIWEKTKERARLPDLASSPAASRRSLTQWLLVAAAAVLLVGVGILLMTLRSDDLVKPVVPEVSKKKGKEKVKVKAEPVAALNEDERQKLKTLWTGYVQDYKQWLSPLVTSKGVRSIASPYLLTNLQAVIGSVGPLGFEPLKVYGEEDTLNLTAPDLRVLEGRRAFLTLATGARDQIKVLLVEKYPRKLADDLQFFSGTPLEAAARALLPEAKVVSLSAEVFLQVRGLEAVESRAADLRREWEAWKAVREGVARYDLPSLGPLLAGRESGALSTVTNWAELTNRLTILRREESVTQEWLEQTWPRIDQAGFRSELAHTNLPSLAAWTNLATGHTLLFPNPGADPRRQLQDQLERGGVANQVRDIAAAAQAGQGAVAADAPRLTQKLGEILSRTLALTNLPAVRQNEGAVRGQIAQVTAEVASFTRQVQEAWGKVLDFKELIAQQQRTGFDSPRITGLWTNYLERVDQRVRGKSPQPPRETVMLWRTNLDRARSFLTNLAALPLDPVLSSPLNQPDGLRQPGLKELAEQLRSNYCAQFLERNLDGELQVVKTFEDFRATPEKAGLDRAVTRFGAALGLLLQGVSSANRGILPPRLDVFRTNYAILKASPFSAVVNAGSPMTWLRGLGEADWSPLADGRAAAAEALRGSSPDFLRLSLRLARLNEVVDWPGTVEDWNRASDLAAAGRQLVARESTGLDQLAATNALVRWLGWQWEKFGQRVVTFDQVKASVGKLVELHIGVPEVSAGLAYNYKLAGLMDSFDPAAPAAFQKRTRQFLDAGGAGASLPAAHHTILREIMAVSADGTDANALEPRKRGLSVELGTNGVARLVRAGVPHEFKLLTAAETAQVYVAVSEFPCDAFLRLVNESTNSYAWLWDLQVTMKDLNGEKIRFYEHPLNYLNNLKPSIINNGATLEKVVLRGSRTVGEAGKFASSPALQECATVRSDFPVNFISAEMAKWAAEAWGCRLLTPREWSAIDRSLPAQTKANLGGNRFGLVYRELERLEPGAAKALPSFFFRGAPSASGGDGVGDVPALFSEVGNPAFEQGGLIHWRGNVAEILAEGGQFFIAGGSFSAQGTRFDPVAVPRDRTRRGYADVGFRLTFDWVGIKPADRIRGLLAQLRPAASP